MEDVQESCTCLAGADAAMSAGWLQSIQSQRSQAAWVERTEGEQETGRQQTFSDKDTTKKNTTETALITLFKKITTPATPKAK